MFEADVEYATPSSTEKEGLVIDRQFPPESRPCDNFALEPVVKKFLAVYIGTASAREQSGWESMSEKQRQEKQKSGMEAWGQWMESHRESIVDSGTPLGKTKRMSGQGIADTKNYIVAYVIVQADSHEAAARLFEKHPHFMIFPGDSVEVMECVPMPGA